MKNILFLLVFLVAYVTMSCATGQESGPVVNGRSLSFWLRTWIEKSSSASQRAEAQRAFKQASTNAIPYLLKELTTGDAVEKSGTASVEDIRQGIERTIAAEAALRFMGSCVTSAIPELTKLMASSDYGAVRGAAEILSDLGPPGVHALVGGLTNTSPDSLAAIAAVLRNMGTNIFAEVPALFKSLDGLPKSASFDCCFAITQSGVAVTNLVHEFTNRLQSRNAITRYVSVMTHGEMRTNALEAVPYLRKLRDDPVKDVRDAAEWALAQIETK